MSGRVQFNKDLNRIAKGIIISWIIGIIFSLGVLCFLGYAVIHFLMKGW